MLDYLPQRPVLAAGEYHRRYLLLNLAQVVTAIHRPGLCRFARNLPINLSLGSAPSAAIFAR